MSPPDDRETYRPKTPPAGVRAQTLQGTPVEASDEITGQHEAGLIDAMELARLRGRRPTRERVDRLDVKFDQLDDKQDQLIANVGSLAISISELKGEMKVIPKLVEILEKTHEQAAQRQTLTLTAQLDTDKLKTTQQLDLEKASAVDKLDAAKQWRGVVVGAALKAVGFLGGIALIVIAVLQGVQTKGCGG